MRRTARPRTRRSRRRTPRPDAILRRNRGLAGLLLVITLSALIVLDQRGMLLAPRGDDAVYHEAHVSLVRVIDGDTFEIAMPDPREGGATTRVRLIGVDAPELARQGRPAEAFALEASAFAESVAEGRVVILRLEPERTRDRYGRLLAHVWLGEGGAGGSLADALIERGLARAENRWPHRDLERHAALERAARRAGAGVWGGD